MQSIDGTSAVTSSFPDRNIAYITPILTRRYGLSISSIEVLNKDDIKRLAGNWIRLAQDRDEGYKRKETYD